MFTFSLFTEFPPPFGFLIDWLPTLSLAVGKRRDSEFPLCWTAEFLSLRGNLEVLEGQFMDGGKFRLSPGLRRGGEANLPSRALEFPGFLFRTLPVSFLRFCCRKFNEMVGFRFLLLESELLGGGEGGERLWGG